MRARPEDVRLVVADDLPAIRSILADEIRDGYAHFALEPPTLDELREELRRAAGRHPWVVATGASEGVIGFARCAPWKSRGAYRWTTEIGVYVDARHRGRGVGVALYTALFPLIEAHSLKSVLAGITLPNAASVRLHERFGMVHVGTLPHVGFKHAAWRSVGYWHRFLGDPHTDVAAERQPG